MKNQCDGCCAGLPVRKGVHYWKGRGVMVCQKHEYKKEEKNDPTATNAKPDDSAA